MYEPKLRYVFCLMRVRSLWSQLSLMKYLNSFGVVPKIMHESRFRVEISEALKKSRVKYKRFRSDRKPKYDIMFSESSGHSSFEKSSLVASKNIGKINIKLNNAISLYQNIINTNYTPDKTIDTLDIMVMKGQRTIDHYKKFTKNLAFINAGDPDWDIVNTREFQEKVNSFKTKHGNKILLIGVAFLNKNDEEPWCLRMIDQAKKKGFKVILSYHIGLPKGNIPLSLRNYVDFETPRFVLFNAAALIATNICSTMLADSLFFGKKIACSGSLPHLYKYGRPHVWIDDYEKWRTNALSKVGQDLFGVIPRAVTEEEIDKFLTSKSVIDQTKIDNIFGWERVPNYCENLFQKVEEVLL